jgi:hypothetical protein
MDKNKLIQTESLINFLGKKGSNRLTPNTDEWKK